MCKGLVLLFSPKITCFLVFFLHFHLKTSWNGLLPHIQVLSGAFGPPLMDLWAVGYAHVWPTCSLWCLWPTTSEHGPVCKANLPYGPVISGKNSPYGAYWPLNRPKKAQKGLFLPVFCPFFTDFVVFANIFRSFLTHKNIFASFCAHLKYFW